MTTGHLREVQHFERPVSPLFSTLVLPAVEGGFSDFSTARGGRPGGLRFLVHQHRVYVRAQAPDPLPEAPPVGLPEIVARWEREAIPEVRRLQDEARTSCLRAGAPRRVAADFARLGDLLRRQYAILYEANHLMGTTTLALEAQLGQAGDPAPERSAALLLSPCDSLLRATDAWLAGLAARLDGSPLLADPPRLVAALEEGDDEAAREFRRWWPEVRERPSGMDLRDPTWGEDPSRLARALRGGRATLAAFEAGTARALARRDEAERAAAERFPEAVRGALPGVLALVRRARGLHQDQNHLVGERALGLARLASLRAGEALVLQGDLARAEDVTLLTHEEAVGALRGEPLPRGLVERRRAEWEAAPAIEPPATLGDVPRAVLEDARLLARLGARAAASGALRGTPASPGRARGVVRVVRDEAELEATAPGDVLALVALPPTWTASALRAAALVTEAGGMLSHAAIVAREMGVPAVVGVPGATERLAEGALVEVDGDAGEVRVVRGPERG